MESKRRRQPWVIGTAPVLWVVLLGVPAAPAADRKVLDALKREAQIAEADHQWDRACRLYDQLLTLDRHQPGVREHYLLCFRHANLVSRHRDPSYQQFLSQDTPFALRVYREVVGKLRLNYYQKEKTDLNQLFQYGLDQLAFALDDEVFRLEHLPLGIKAADVQAFQAQLRERWRRPAIRDLRDAQDRVLEVAMAARKALDLKPAVTVLELACGACSGLDEYTFYLTPGQVMEEFTSLSGEFVGVGVEVTVRDQRALVAQVVMGSPAALGGLKPDDWITRIDKKPVFGLSEAAVNERLKGAAGSLVELEVVPSGDMKPRTLILTRQVLHIPSVVQAQLLPAEHPGIAYCRILTFQKTTARELDDALVELKMQGMRVLILDLRGNQGGMFEAGLQVAGRFLTKGKVITVTGSDYPERNRRFQADSPDAVDVPLVILVDGETASAAELVAGALQKNGRATLVGLPTFGKWSVQRVFQLDTGGAGVRLTLVRFLSPANKPYDPEGISPDRRVERSLAGMRDMQLEAAIQVAIDLSLMQQ